MSTHAWPDGRVRSCATTCAEVEGNLAPDAAKAATANAPFFVVGASRSGTTLLRLFLTSHSMVHIPRETWFLIDLMSRLPHDRPLNQDEVHTAKSLVLNHVRWPDWEMSDEALHQAFDAQPAPRLRDLVESLYDLELRRSGKSVWGDKTPDYLTQIESLSKLFPDSRFIHLIRDARDTSRSLLNRKWHGRHLFRAACYWARSVGAGIDQGQRLPPDRYFEVHYEDLVLHPEDTIRTICEFLHIPFEEEMLSCHQDSVRHIPAWARGHHQKLSRPPQSDDVGIWRRNMSRREIMVVEAIAGHVMDQVGQERLYPKAIRALRFGLLPADSLLRVTHPLRQRLGLVTVV